jgi:pimeloyl-ACP methyl ester carboxylesterase
MRERRVGRAQGSGGPTKASSTAVRSTVGRSVSPSRHGDDDQFGPIEDAGKKSAKLLKQGTLKIIPGAPHGICTTRADELSQELLAFIRE